MEGAKLGNAMRLDKLGTLALAAVIAVAGSAGSCRRGDDLPSARQVPLTAWEGSELQPALTPGGDRVAFVWDGEVPERYDLYVMASGNGEPRRLTSSPGAAGHPAWSPDALQVAFLQKKTDGRTGLMLLPAEGGDPRELTQVASVGFPGLDWSPDGRWLAVVDRESPKSAEAIFLVSSESGERRKLTAPPSAGVGDRNPVFSPGGASLAYVRWYEAPLTEVFVQAISGGEPRLLTRHEGWIRGLDWMPDSTSLVFSSYWMGTTGLWRLSMRGEVSPLPFGQHATELSIASSGERLVFSQRIPDTNIWRTRGPSAPASTPPVGERFIASERDEWAPDISPDGTRVAFTSDRSGVAQIWVADGEGNDPARLATEETASTARWSPDGRSLVFGLQTEGDADVFVVEVDSGSRRRLTFSEATDIPWSWSRDGTRVYFFSDRTGRYEIWQAPASGGEPQQITLNGGLFPRESEDGRFIYFMKADLSAIWRVPTGGGEEVIVLTGEGLSRSAFTVWRRSLIYLVQDGESGSRIESFEPDTGEVEVVAELGRDTRIGKYGRLSVSPDGRWVLYPRDDSRGSDLVLVENFR